MNTHTGYTCEQMIERARAHMHDLCQGRRTWRMSIPVNMELDSDMIFSDVIDLAERSRAALVERDATIVKLTKALSEIRDEEISGRSNDEGEDYVQCDRCNATTWGSHKSDIEHYDRCVFAGLACTSL